jgi:hypothetical protein
MVLDPRLPRIEEVMTGSPFDIITTPFGVMERWRASTLATGTMGMFQNVYDAVRADSTALAARADEAEARNALIEHLCTKVAEFEQRFNDHEARLAEAEDKRRADEAREAEFNEEPLALPPEPDDPTAQDNINTHEPSGDLHTLTAKEEPPEPLAEDQELPSELPEPPLELEADAKGVPLSYGNVPTSSVHSRDQVEFAIPEPGMTDARKRKPRGGIVSQPTAISLNEG